MPPSIVRYLWRKQRDIGKDDSIYLDDTPNQDLYTKFLMKWMNLNSIVDTTTLYIISTTSYGMRTIVSYIIVNSNFIAKTIHSFLN